MSKLSAKLLEPLWASVKEVGVTEVSRRANIDRVHLYEMFSEHGNPKIDTVVKVAYAVNLSLSFGFVEDW